MRVSIEVSVHWGTTTLAVWTRRAPWRFRLGEGGFAVPPRMLPTASVTFLEADRHGGGLWLTLLPGTSGTITWPTGWRRGTGSDAPRTTTLAELYASSSSGSAPTREAPQRVWLPPGSSAEIALTTAAGASPYRSGGVEHDVALTFHVAVSDTAPARPPRFGRAGRVALLACASAMLHLVALTAAAMVMPPLDDMWEDDEPGWRWPPPPRITSWPAECLPPTGQGSTRYGAAIDTALALQHRATPNWPGCSEAACCVAPSPIAIDDPDSTDHPEGEVPEVARCFGARPAEPPRLPGIGDSIGSATRRGGVARFGRFDLRFDDEENTWLQSAIDGLRPRLENCYDRALVEDPDLLGGMEVGVDARLAPESVDDEDSTDEVQVTVTLRARGRLKNERLMCCVAEVSEALGQRMVEGRLRYSVGFRPALRPAR